MSLGLKRSFHLNETINTGVDTKDGGLIFVFLFLLKEGKNEERRRKGILITLTSRKVRTKET